ncbi:MAG: DUF4355 domain-containing protein, partial [Bifidobacteriaceae bacterium]|nr:DUF4355 domain-containing protein [Bifidobacteriaceae bacterium]
MTTPAIPAAPAQPDSAQPAPAGASAQPPAGGGAARPWSAPGSQEELDRIISERLARERAKFGDYEDLKAKAAKWEEAEDAAKSEAQRAIERAEKAEAALKDREAKDALAALRAEVAAAKAEAGLPAGAADLLAGSTREELEASADKLVAVFGAGGRKGAVGPYVPSEGKPVTRTPAG